MRRGSVSGLTRFTFLQLFTGRAWSLILAFDRAPAADLQWKVCGGGRELRLHRRRLQQLAQRVMGGESGFDLGYVGRPLRTLSDRCKRIYTAGNVGRSAGSHASGAQLGPIAGVIASSAGFPDSVPRKACLSPSSVRPDGGLQTISRCAFSTRSLTTPHRVAIFEGGHTWLSSELAAEAVGWMEIQAMKSGRRARDAALIDKTVRQAGGAAAAQTNDKDTALALAAWRRT